MTARKSPYPPKSRKPAAEPVEFLDGKVVMYPGDCLDVLARLPENSVDSVVCDPPYHLTSIVKRFGVTAHADDTKTSDRARTGADGMARFLKGFMGKQWDGGDIAFQPSTWAAVLRVLKPGGYILAFASSRGFGRMSVAIEDAGFINHPLIGWIFGSGFPKATRVKAEGYDGFRYGGQAMKPALEPIYLGQKPFSEATGTANILHWGTGALNIDDCRIEPELPRPDRVKIGGDSNGIYGDGLNNSRAVVDTMRGRWPANVILSHPEDEYQLSPHATPAQRQELYRWLSENS